MDPPEGSGGGDGAPGEAGGLSALERRVSEAVDVEEMVTLLAELVPIRSLTGEPGEVEAQERVAEAMEAAGLETDVWELDFDRLRRHPAYSAEVERERGLGVVGRLGAGEGPTLALNGHVDVVPAGDEERWTRPPWRATVEDGWVYGRGTADMKGAVCAALHAAKALREAGAELEGTLSLQSVIGEEDGGCGTLAAVLRGYTGEGAVVLEPTRLAVAPAQAGALNFRLTVPGRAAHGALRAEGVDPVEKFVPLFRRIRELEAERNRRADDPLYAG